MRPAIPALLFLLGGCTQVPAPTITDDTREADEAAVRATASRWEQAIASRDLDRIAAFYTDDAWQLPEQGSIASDDASRRAFWQQIGKLPVATDTVDVSGRIEVAQSGEMAVQYGDFRQIITDREGNMVSVPQKFMTTWRKQQDGTWKVSASMATVENVDALASATQRAGAARP